MSRRGGIRIKKIEPDPIYKNRLITKLINRSMKDGKKSVAQKEVYQALEIIKGKDQDPMQIFSTCRKYKP